MQDAVVDSKVRRREKYFYEANGAKRNETLIRKSDVAVRGINKRGKRKERAGMDFGSSSSDLAIPTHDLPHLARGCCIIHRSVFHSSLLPLLQSQTTVLKMCKHSSGCGTSDTIACKSCGIALCKGCKRNVATGVPTKSGNSGACGTCGKAWY